MRMKYSSTDYHAVLEWTFLSDDLDQIAKKIIQENQWIGQDEIVEYLRGRVPLL